MTTRNEYAALSAHVYNDQRGGGSDSLVNRLELPPNWISLSQMGFTTGDNLNTNPFSAAAGAYLKQNTGEIVVAYKGTDLLTTFEGRSWNTVVDLVADAGLALAFRQLNVPFQLYASSYYAAVKDWAADNGYDGNKISFTGHSLGGGLAANMAVWFDRPAVTFAEAPFELSTGNRIAMVNAITALTLQAAASGSAAVLDAINPLRELLLSLPAILNGDKGSVFTSREARVANYYNQGEALEYVRSGLTTVYGTSEAIDIGSQPISRALALHSINLHAAFLFDDRLRALAKNVPELIPALLNTKLHAANPTSATKDLITFLVNDQLRQGFASDSALKRFTTDIEQLKGAAGATAQDPWRTALIAVAMDYHYDADPATSATLFTFESGALHFDLNDVDSAFLTSLPLLRAAAKGTSGESTPYIAQSWFNSASVWHVQTGAGAMNWQETTIANDAAIGGIQADVLRSGQGEDVLVGGDGDDLLDGGTGRDILLGGGGIDTYQFAGSFGKDSVRSVRSVRRWRPLSTVQIAGHGWAMR